MADTEYEEFRRTFENLPTSRRNFNTTPFYSLIPGIETFEDSPSPKSDLSDQEDNSSSNNNHSGVGGGGGGGVDRENIKRFDLKERNKENRQVDDDDEIGDGLKIVNSSLGVVGGLEGGAHETTILRHHHHSHSSFGKELERTSSMQSMNGERRRRKLPEIPKNQKSSILFLCSQSQSSLADEMNHAHTTTTTMTPNTTIFPTLQHPQNNQHSSQTNLVQKSFLSLKCGYLLDEDSSPDSERMQSLGDVDSGHSTAHSPNDFKSMSPQLTSSPITITHSSSTIYPLTSLNSSHGGCGNAAAAGNGGGIPFNQLEMLEATHRGLHKFMPRHHDEIDIEIGDPIYVQKEADDLWCEGVNLRTGRQGIFPSAYAVDLDYNDFDPTSNQVKKERYLLGYLGSVETTAHKGTGVVCQAVRKIVGEYGDSPNGQACILEVSDQGLRMVDRSRPNGKKEKRPCIDYFYSLKNVSFCAFHPRDHRYIGFITKHPTVQRFACHVFKGSDSTRPVAEAVGRAFQRFYQKFIETAYPIEDIYIE